jgi:hypothetical protein
MPRLVRALLPLVFVLLAACGREETQGIGPPRGTDGQISTGGDGALEGSDAGQLLADGSGEKTDFGSFEEPDGAIEIDAGSVEDAGGDGDSSFAEDAPEMVGEAGPEDVAIVSMDVGVAPSDGAVVPDAGAGCTTDQECRLSGDGRFCETSSGRCVECANDMQCFSPQICDETGGNVCRNPCFNGRCGRGSVCDPSINACVECVTSLDCGSGEVCDPSSRSCVECLGNADCAGAVEAPFCDLTEKECVGCRDRADCGPNQICEQNAHVCTSTGTRGLCEPCDDDAQCGGPEDLCIGYLGPNGLFDRSCAQDCTNSSCPSGFECVTVRGSSLQCRPRYPMQTPTCTAIRHLGASCTFSATDPDPGCGLPNLQDARCIVDTASGGGVCVIWCTGPEHCPAGFTCSVTGGNATGVCL